MEHEAGAGFQLPVALTVINREGEIKIWRIDEGERREVVH
jgi:hypothetical protein